MWWSILWNAVSGNLGGIVSAITGYLNKINDNKTELVKLGIGGDTQVAIAQLKAAAEIHHDRADFYKGMRVTQWLIAAALIPPLLHQGMIYMDSIPFFLHSVGDWAVPKAPPPYDDREWLMISSLLGIQGAMSLGLGLVKTLVKR